MKSENRIQKNKIRRIRQLRRNLAMLFFSIVFIISLSVGGFALGAKAQDKEEIILYKYYTNIEVQYGENLEDIAKTYFCPEKYKDYNDYISEVMLVNGLYCEEITAGSFLIVPYYSSEFK